MPRPRKFDEAEVIYAAGEVFARNGFRGTTIDDLTVATGVGKQSLYNAFGGKRGLFLKSLSARVSDAVGAVDDALAGPDSSPLERIHAQMLRLALSLSDPGREESLFTSATVELGYRDAEVAETAGRALARLTAIYEACIVDAQRSGEIAAHADAAALATFFVAVTRGMEVMAYAGLGRDELTAAAVTSLATLPLVDNGGDAGTGSGPSGETTLRVTHEHI